MRPRNTITLIILGACLVGWLVWFWPKDYADSSQQRGNDKSDVTKDKPATSPAPLDVDAGRDQAKESGRSNSH
jgi:hypothetical protein